MMINPIGMHHTSIMSLNLYILRLKLNYNVLLKLLYLKVSVCYQIETISIMLLEGKVKQKIEWMYNWSPNKWQKVTYMYLGLKNWCVVNSRLRNSWTYEMYLFWRDGIKVKTDKIVISYVEVSCRIFYVPVKFEITTKLSSLVHIFCYYSII